MKYKIRQIREEKHMSQEKLAKLANVTRKTIISIENDESYNVTVNTLLSISDALETPIEKLFCAETV